MLRRCSYLKVFTYPLGPIQTNCYIVQKDNVALIFDPGEEANKIEQALEQLKVQPVAILLTHAHFDHIGAVDAIREKYKIPVYVHEVEADWLTNPQLNGSGKYVGFPNVQLRPAEQLIQKEGPLQIDNFVMEVRHTPGHSPGSVTYIFENGKFAIVGDTLFNKSIGRTDLPGGDTATLLSSIHEKLLTLHENCILLPGHGPSTTPKDEQHANPFLQPY